MKSLTLLSFTTLLLLLFSGGGNAQETTLATTLAQPDQIADVPTQQIGRARSGYVSEADVENVPAPTCGPKWLGGCFDVHAPRRSNLTVLKDPYFLWPTIADGLVTSLDGAVTAYGLSHSRCEEANADLGRNPGTGTIVGYNALIFGATTGFRFVALKAIPKDSHSRWVWIPRAFSVGTAARSAQVHIRGARTWFTSGCL